METTTKDGLSRGQFLKSLGLSTSALMAFYCIGTMTSCSGSSDDPSPGGGGGGGGGGGNGVSGTITGSNINFTVDLTNSTYTKLKTAGEAVIIGDVLVAFTTQSTYVALTKICTHEGNTIQYRKAQNDLYCPFHESEYSVTGAVEKGPATLALKAYTVTLSGNTLTVKS